jgi:hypothetical protein
VPAENQKESEGDYSPVSTAKVRNIWSLVLHRHNHLLYSMEHNNRGSFVFIVCETTGWLRTVDWKGMETGHPRTMHTEPQHFQLVCGMKWLEGESIISFINSAEMISLWYHNTTKDLITRRWSRKWHKHPKTGICNLQPNDHILLNLNTVIPK